VIGSLAGFPLAPPFSAPALGTVITLLALAGWGVVAAALHELLRARRRLEAVARAEHELRGPATVLLLACERMRREPTGRRHARALEVELERMASGLAALTAARSGGPPRPFPRSRSERDLGARSGGPTQLFPRSCSEGDLAERSGDSPRSLPRPRPPGEDLASFVGSALDGWAPTLRAAGRPARLAWRAGRVPLPKQRGAIASVLGNLVANAAEHGTGPVEVHGSRVPGAVRVEVRNQARPDGQRRRGRGLKVATAAAKQAGGSIAIERTSRDVRAVFELPIDVSTAFEDWPVRLGRRRDVELVQDELRRKRSAAARAVDPDGPSAA
jgi:signal transduction histidine kinase